MEIFEMLKTAAGQHIDLGTVAIVLAVLYFGYTFVKRIVVGIITGFATSIFALLSRFSYTMVASGLLSITGLTGIGYGIGELNSGEAKPFVQKPLTNEQVIDLIKVKDMNKDNLTLLVDYTKARDGTGNKPLSNDELLKLVTNEKLNKEALAVMMKYIEVRDGDGKTEHVSAFRGTTTDAKVEPPKTPIYRFAWTAILGGLGALGVGIMTFIIKINLPAKT